MNYKHFIIIILAVLLDTVLGIFFSGISPIFLIGVVLFFSLKLDFPELIFISLLGGFLFDMTELSSSLFFTISLPLQACVVKLLGRKLIDFKSRVTQLISFVVLIMIKVLVFYLVYDRSLNSIFISRNLLLISMISLILTCWYLIKSSNAKKI